MLCAAIVTLVPMLVLIGWSLNNQILTRVYPAFTPMNPVTAICFLLIAACMLAAHSKESSRQKSVFRAAGIILVGVGVCMLVFYTFHYDLGIDRLLFTSLLGINRMAITTSICFLLLGLYFLVYPRMRWLTSGLRVIISLISVYTLIAYLYNFVGVYGQTLFNPMAIHTAVLFLISSFYFQMHDGFWNGRTAAILRKLNIFAPLVAFGVWVFAMIVVIGATTLIHGSTTDQSRTRFESQATQIAAFIQSRMSLYGNVVYGLEGLFAASNSVEESEWQSYIAELNVPVNYGGISGLSYAPRVLAKDKAKFGYDIYPAADKPEYFALDYSVSFASTTAVSARGFDYSSDPDRNKTLRTAISIGRPVATPVVLGATNKIPLFSIYAPVYKNATKHDDAASRAANAAGIVAASFRLERIFPDLVKNPLFDETVAIGIFDTTDASSTKGTELYSLDSPVIDEVHPDFVNSSIISVAERNWTIRTMSMEQLNLPPFERNASTIFLITGSMLAVIIGIIAFFYVRSRERVLQTKALQLATLLESFPYGVLIEDENRNLLITNQHMVDALGPGHKPAEFIGHDMRTVMAVAGRVFKDFDTFGKHIENAISSRKAFTDEKVEMSNGTYAGVSYAPIYESGEYRGGIWIYKDITEEQRIDQMKSEFVSLASHQLRTPLTSIKWYAELLRDKTVGPLNSEQDGYVGEISDATERMVDLVNSLLNVSRLELGTFAIEPVETDLVALMESTAREQEPTFKAKKQVFSFTHTDAIEKMLIDPKITRIVVQNLLSNAHKYTPEGGKITLSLVKHEQNVVIECADNGYGIPRGQQASVFKKLFRADNIRTLDVEGTGLGLYIIKTVVEAAGCAIAFTSQENSGTTFTITIPMAGMMKRSGTKPLSTNEKGDAIIK